MADFFNDLNKFNKLKTEKEKTKKKKITNAYDTVSGLYNDLLGIHFDEYYDLSDAERKKSKHEYKPKMLFLKLYNYDKWLNNV